MLGGKFHRLKWFVMVLAIPCAGIVIAVWSARSQYENRLTQQIWPANTPSISAQSNPPGNPAPAVLLLGDSRMAQWGLPTLSGWRVVNAGAGGLTTGQLRLCAPGLLDEFRPHTVVIEAGINDLKFIGLRPEMSQQIVSLAASNLTAIVHESAALHCQVIVLETWPAVRPGFLRRLVWNAEIPAAVDSLNAQLRSLNSPEKGIRVVDLFKEAGLPPDTNLYSDTLHLNPEVYSRLTLALESALEAGRRTGQ